MLLAQILTLYAVVGFVLFLRHIGNGPVEIRWYDMMIFITFWPVYLLFRIIKK